MGYPELQEKIRIIPGRFLGSVPWFVSHYPTNLTDIKLIALYSSKQISTCWFVGHEPRNCQNLGY